MERDYFKDRPETVQYNKNLYRGENVFICLKKMQPYAKEISDLTLTKITANLTKQYQHPRGQKIKGDKVELDKYGNKILADEYEEVVGRCTYILDDNGWSFDTKEGKKFLIYNNKKDKLEMLPYSLLKGYMKIFVLLRANNACFKIPICKFVYFNDMIIAQNFLDNLVFSDIVYNGNQITMTLNNTRIYEDDFKMYLNDKQIFDDKEMFDYLTLLYGNKDVPLEIENFILEKIL